ILDNLFDHLDQPSRKELKVRLMELSASVSIIQLSNREDQLLPFINNTGSINDASFNISEINKSTKIQTNQTLDNFPGSLLSFDKTYEYILKFENVNVSYNDQPIVKNIDWEIKPGEFWQLIGPNGSGKSTLLSLITGENPKAYGQNILIFDWKKGSGESIWD